MPRRAAPSLRHVRRLRLSVEQLVSMPRRAAPSLRLRGTGRIGRWHRVSMPRRAAPSLRLGDILLDATEVKVSMPRRAAPSLRLKTTGFGPMNNWGFNAPKGGPKPETTATNATERFRSCFNAPKGGPKPETLDKAVRLMTELVSMPRRAAPSLRPSATSPDQII